MSRELVRRQWDANTEYWLSKVRTGEDIYREFMNKPYYLNMVGEVSGLNMLDLACGEGYFSRIFAQSGARVTGIDFSGEMIKAALVEEEKESLGVNYIQADAADLHMLEAGSFDIVCSFMAIMDIKDYKGAIRETSRVLRENGRFVSIFLHPCFSWRREKEGKIMVDWERKKQEASLKEYLYLKVYDYFTQHSYEMTWKNKETGESQETTQFHRTMSDYVNTFAEAGLLIWKMEEPKPISEEVPHRMQKLFRIPHSILIEAVKKS